MAEANTEDFFLHRVQFFEQIHEPADPEVVGVGVAAAAGDDEAVVAADSVVFGELAGGNAVHVPHLAVLRQHYHENPKIPPVLLLHEIGVLSAVQHREFLRAPHSLSKIIDFGERDRGMLGGGGVESVWSNLRLFINRLTECVWEQNMIGGVIYEIVPDWLVYLVALEEIIVDG